MSKLPPAGKYRLQLNVELKKDDSFSGSLDFPDKLTPEQAELFLLFFVDKVQQHRWEKKRKEENEKYKKLSLWEKVKYFVAH
jgi:hypothetical protein